MRSILFACLLVCLAPVSRAEITASRVLEKAPAESEWQAAHQAAIYLAGGKHVWCSAVDTSAPGVAGDVITIVVGATDSRTAIVRFVRSSRKATLLAPLSATTIQPDFAPAVLAVIGEEVARNLAQLFWARLIQEDMLAGREDAAGYIVARSVASRSTGLMREEAITARLLLK